MYILGLMSGTSLDGLDVAYCQFTSPRSFKLLASHTFPYPAEWVQRLQSLHLASAYEYALANVELGHYFGQRVCEFRTMHPGPVDLISSHGHTVFHQPQLGLTTQIGCGDAIAAETGVPVAFNFRTFDVASGGQGAPLVPIGDDLLFAQYDGCLNLGGFSNISFTQQGIRRAFDISPCNMALNYLSSFLGLPFDPYGKYAHQGRIIDTLLHEMEHLDYYSQTGPKSLGKEWFDTQFKPLLQSPEEVTDKLRTTVEHIALRIASVVNTHHLRTLIATGGGALNTYLMQRLQHHCGQCKIEVPEKAVVEYKEAIIFALLGYLRVNGLPNTLASVTGARADSIGGCISGIAAGKNPIVTPFQS